MRIAVDFDGTIVDHDYPYIGKEKPFAIDTLRQLVADGHQLILWSVRKGALLDEAVAWCEKRGLKFYAVNTNHPSNALSFKTGTESSPKISVDVYIDDRNVGGLPDWGDIYQIITGKAEERFHKKKKKGFHLFGR